ncbi:glycosyltransferase family 4 protein [Paenibacillus dendritiformis]|uniref:glycosyltransferase family 4 protein n=1 Tax=Paenibacillus dendritiformis TaxID=130049 RepID=UPI00248C4672|nr:glycosyltransferase family 4 protein [Paenibacillus dendritiformis]WGU93813.1 glycosyltransferase family 4 protein [Paenibacillus dendritiformis]
MKKVAYFSPLNPIRSGISDYSEDLIPYLSKHFEIDIYVPEGMEPSSPHISNKYNILTHSKFERKYTRGDYDALIYHMGNNYNGHKEIYEFMIRYPGIVVLHDYSLHHFFAEKTISRGYVDEYKEEVLYSHGVEGLHAVEEFLAGKAEPLWESKSLQFPMNLRVLDRAAGIIVHSEFAKRFIEKTAPYVPVEVIPIPTPNISEQEQLEQEKLNARQELNIDPSAFIISSLGFANHTKRIDKVLLAISKIKSKYPIIIETLKYYIVGEIAPSYNLEEMIRKHGLQNNVVCIGYVDINEFDKYIMASDVCMNLRYPTQGENSASLVKILGRGKPVVATDIGTFREFPDNLVVKVGYGDTEVESIMKNIISLRVGDSNFDNKDCLDYVNSEHSLKKVSKKYVSFLNEILLGEKKNLNLAIDKYVNTYITLIQGISVTDHFIIELLTQNYSHNLLDLVNEKD